MKNKVRFIKAFSVFLVIAALFNTVAFAACTDPERSAPCDVYGPNATYYMEDGTLYITVNEYDIKLESMAQEAKALEEAGYSLQEIEESRTYSAEKKLLELAELPDEQLIALGYTSEQIDILKAYDGSPLEENPQLRAAMPSLTTSVTAGDCNSQHLCAHLNWEWSAAPATYDYQDVVVCQFEAFDQGGYTIGAVQYNTSYTNSYVRYYNYDTGAFYSTKRTPITTQNAYSNFLSKFDRIIVGSTNAYVKSGSVNGYIQLSTGVTNSINKGTFIFAYGYAETSASYSISFPLAVSAALAKKVSQAFFTQVTINSAGELTVNI